MSKNTFVVIEGLDGTGKATQSKILAERLNATLFSFPNYQSKSSGLVEMYLNGEFGNNASVVDPYQASTMFAVDRLGTYLKEMKPILDTGKVVVADRYTTSNLLYQTAKFDGAFEKRAFMEWVYEFEYGRLKLPVPTQTFLLSVPFNTFVRMMKERNDNKHHGKDIHEGDVSYLEKVYNNTQFVAEALGWDVIECVDSDGNLLSRSEIHEKIFSRLD